MQTFFEAGSYFGVKITGWKHTILEKGKDKLVFYFGRVLNGNGAYKVVPLTGSCYMYVVYSSNQIS